MRYAITLFTFLTLTFMTAVRSEAQFYPELGFPLSAGANAMGGAGAAFVSDDPLATTLNPAQLGLTSLNGFVSAGIAPGLNVFPNYTTLSNSWYLTGMSRIPAVSYKR